MIRFALRTASGPAEVEAPLPEPAAWHDLAARYDGRTLDLFFDGRRVASRAWTGPLARTDEPLLLAAEKTDGPARRHFHGEMQAAALWDRALTDAEIAQLSRVAAAPQPQ